MVDRIAPAPAAGREGARPEPASERWSVELVLPDGDRVRVVVRSQKGELAAGNARAGAGSRAGQRPGPARPRWPSWARSRRESGELSQQSTSQQSSASVGSDIDEGLPVSFDDSGALDIEDEPAAEAMPAALPRAPTPDALPAIAPSAWPSGPMQPVAPRASLSVPPPPPGLIAPMGAKIAARGRTASIPSPIVPAEVKAQRPCRPYRPMRPRWWSPTSCNPPACRFPPTRAVSTRSTRQRLRCPK